MPSISGRSHSADRPQLDLFAASVATRPYCTDNLADGLRILPAVAALEHRYIQTNPPAKIHWIVFDIDRPYYQGDWRTKATPNIICRNPVNSHAHLFYGLATPVTRTSMARVAPLRYLNNIVEALRYELDADPGYTGLIAKNPTHPHWQIETPRNSLYKLDELDEHCDLVASAERIRKTPKRQRSGNGRNTCLFDSLSAWSYREIGRYRSRLTTSGFDGWHDVVADKAGKLNTFATPLPASEIRAIARSVARWTWTRYDGRRNGPDADYRGLPANTFSMVQSSLGKMGNLARHGDNTAKQTEALRMSTGGLSQSEIAGQLEISQQTVSRWLQQK